MIKRNLIFCLAIFIHASSAVDIVSFDGVDELSTWEWREINDPVMGGISEATFEIKDGIAVFDGNCAIVPALKAPGFCNAETVDGNRGIEPKGIDASGSTHLLMDVKSSIDYKGFKISLAADTNNPQFESFKADFDVPVSNEWTTVAIPFAEFSNKWSMYTGEATVKCVDDPSVCMSEINKQHFSQVGLWAEGVEGKFHLEVKNIRAEDVPAGLLETLAAESSSVPIVAEEVEEEEPSTEPCCNACVDPEQKKYYSIDLKHGFCGEVCMKPSSFWLFKIFEPGLHDAKGVNNVCAQNAYSGYVQTVTHGFGPLKISLDLYAPDSPSPAAGAGGDGDGVDIVTFDGANPVSTWHFREVNDPVMGGQSTGSFEIIDGVGVFTGTCAIVPSLNAPGFCKTESTDGFGIKRKGIDASGKSHIAMEVRSSIPYDGYKIAFTADTLSSFFSFKANVAIPVSDDFITVTVPFTDFSNKWSPATGEAKVKCVDDPSVCMSEINKQHFSQVGFWAEGHEGDFKLEIRSVRAVNLSVDEEDPLTTPTTGTGGDRPKPEDPNKHCLVQTGLRYNMDAQDSIEQMFPVDGDAGETLAAAICCDDRFNIFAEPQFLYERPDIGFLDKVGTEDNPTTYFDSACGLPVFRAPVGRSKEAFLADTEEHGWPSFRKLELIGDNVMVLEDNRVISKCGTMLGSFLPDTEGDRYCIDTVCVSGNPVTTA